MSNHWIHTGSIVDMLERNRVCEFEQEDGKVIVEAGLKGEIAMLSPAMLRFLANELNDMADELESKPT